MFISSFKFYSCIFTFITAYLTYKANNLFIIFFFSAVSLNSPKASAMKPRKTLADIIKIIKWNSIS